MSDVVRAWARHGWARRAFAIYAFNRFNRDEWIRREAQRVPPGARVLDVGAGGAPYAASFAHCAYYKHDLAPLRPEQVQEGGYAALDLVGDIAALPVRDATFDVVLCTEVLEHVPRPGAAVREMARILRPGATLLLTAPLGSGLHQLPYHYYGGYTPAWYERVLGQVGFEQVEITANRGFFAQYGQESIRFTRLLLGEGRAGGLPGLAAGAFGLLSAPWFAGALPALCHLLDASSRCEANRWYPVGYLVKATRGGR